MTAIDDRTTGFGPDSRDWHDALDRGELLLPRCETCARFRFPPMAGCPHCGAAGAGELVAATGEGRVYSWIVARVAFDPSLRAELPYAVVAVDLEEGPRVFGRFLGDATDLDAGLPVRFVPRMTDEGATLAFERAGG